MSRPRVAVSILAFVAAVAPGGPAAAQAPDARFTERAFVTAIEVLAEVRDARGAVPADLTAADFRLLENGIERKIIALDYLDRPSPPPAAPSSQPSAAPAPAEERRWQIVVWFDGMTMSGGTLNSSAREFARRAPELLKLGDVTVVYSDLSPVTLIDSTRDPKRLAQAVETLRKRVPGDRITRIRREFLLALDSVSEIIRENDEGPSVVVGMPVDRQIPAFVEEEDRLLHVGRSNLSRWLARLPRRSPRLLVYVGDGFDIDPQEYYIRALHASGHATTDLAATRVTTETGTKQKSAELMQQLAVAGWTAIAIGGANTSFAGDANRWTGRDNPQKARGIAPTFMFLTPDEPLLQMAEQTGGEHITVPAHLPKALAEIGRRVRITYQVDREPDPKPRRVEIVPLRAGLTVRAARWASSTTSQEVAATRAVDLLAATAPRGDLRTTAALRDGEEGRSIEAKIDLTPLAGAEAQIHATKIRMTVAIEVPGAPAHVIHRIVDIADLGATPRLAWSMPVTLPENAGAIAVVAEELITGSWGGARIGDSAPPAIERAAAMPRTVVAPPAAIADAEQAFARAAAEGKLVIAFEWDEACGPCGEIQRKTTEHSEIARLMQQFVLLAPAASPAEPRIAIYDPARRLFLSRSAMPEKRATPLTVGELTALLQGASAAAPYVLRARMLFANGSGTEAFLAEGLAYREAGEPARAERSYAEAVRAATEAGDASMAQTARALGAMMVANQGRPEEAIRELEAIAAAAATPLNEAEAHLVLGMIHRALGKEKEAAAAFDRTLELAPPASAAYQTAALYARGGPAQVSLAAGPTRPLQLVVGGKPPVSGKVLVQVIVRDPAISSVTFHLDNKPAVTDREPPFEAKLDLGAVPGRHEIRAVARDAGAGIAAEDVVIVNERHDEFWVRLRLSAGSPVVRAETNLPEDARLARLDFFVDGRPVATDASDSSAIHVDSTEDGVVVRAVATLGDGTQAEDALLVGATGYLETIEAREVEIYAAVLDEAGTPSSTIDRSQFTIEENGRRRRIGGFEFLGRAPFSVGLAIDSSSSMLERMPDVHRSARTFLDRVIRDGSSAFLVDFDSSPRLAAPRTNDLPTLKEAVGRIRADGSTALYDAVIFGLLQLQGVLGKRALIVLTDGRDETSRYDFKDAERVARESGVAIYAIILGEPRGEAPAGAMYRMRSGKPWGVDPELEKLAVHTGGRAWYMPEAANMDAIYASIDLELRNQYRLTYRTSPGRGASDWRDVKVTVDVPRATVRSAAGFIAR